MSGTGMFFEGDAMRMHHSLQKFVKLVPAATHLFYGHEYGENNLKFSQWVWPQNKFIEEKLNEVQDKLADRKATVPGLLSEELLYSPFLQCGKKDILA